MAKAKKRESAKLRGLTPASQQLRAAYLEDRKLTAVGLELLDSALRCQDRAAELESIAHAEGLTIGTPHGDKPNPALTAAAEQRRLALAHFRLLNRSEYTAAEVEARSGPFADPVRAG